MKEVLLELTLVELITSSSPEVTNLLGLDITRSERRALKRRGWDLQDRQRRSICCQRLRYSRNAGNERRERKALRDGDQVRNGGNGVLHVGDSQKEEQIGMKGRALRYWMSRFEGIARSLYTPPARLFYPKTL